LAEVYIVRLSFFGKGVHGWQIQPDNITFQKILKNAFKTIYKINDIPNPSGCSRTDANVHALEFLAVMPKLIDIPTNGLNKALNSLLPPNIRVLSVEVRSDIKDGRELVFGKHYRYLISESEFVSPFINSLVHHIRFKLDIKRMSKAADYLVGKHDFKSFMCTGSIVQSTIRTITNVRVSKYNDLIVIDVVGDGFLKNMVRVIAGTLLLIGSKKMEPSFVKTIIEAKNRSCAGNTLPGKGLFLFKLFYSHEEMTSYDIPNFSTDMLFFSRNYN